MFIKSINFLDDEYVRVDYRVGSVNGSIELDGELIDSLPIEEVEYRILSELHSEIVNDSSWDNMRRMSELVEGMRVHNSETDDTLDRILRDQKAMAERYRDY